MTGADLDAALVGLKTQQDALVAIVSHIANDLGYSALARAFAECYQLRAAAWFSFLGFWRRYGESAFEVVDVSGQVGEIVAGEN